MTRLQKRISSLRIRCLPGTTRYFPTSPEFQPLLVQHLSTILSSNCSSISKWVLSPSGTFLGFWSLNDYADSGDRRSWHWGNSCGCYPFLYHLPTLRDFIAGLYPLLVLLSAPFQTGPPLIFPFARWPGNCIVRCGSGRRHVHPECYGPLRNPSAFFFTRSAESRECIFPCHLISVVASPMLVQDRKKHPTNLPKIISDRLMLPWQSFK